MKKKLLIFPYGGNALEALDCISNEYDFLGFIDDDLDKQGQSDLGIPVFSREVLNQYPQTYISIVQASVNSFLKRKEVLATFHLPPEKFVNLIHPSAQISQYAQVGYNCLIMANVVITAKAKIGNHVIILPNTTIHHETEIGDFSWIGSNVCMAGSVKLGEQCWVGSGSSLINNISIGQNTLIGLGSNVLKSFPKNSKIVGNPANQI